MNISHQTPKIFVKVMIGFCFLCVALGSFYSVLLSPKDKANEMMKQAHYLYAQAQGYNDMRLINKQLVQIERLVTKAKYYDPHNEIIAREDAFFTTARGSLEDKTSISSLHINENDMAK